MSVLLTGTTLTVHHVGDSRAVLSSAGKAVHLTCDHVPDSESEQTRIVAAGGSVVEGRLNDLLSVSRAFGDCDPDQRVKLVGVSNSHVCVV